MWINLFGWQINLTWAASVAAVVTVAVAVVRLVWFAWDRILDYRRRREIKRGIVSGLREEIAYNFNDLKKLDLPK